jgi:hypothetical protein
VAVADAAVIEGCVMSDNYSIHRAGWSGHLKVVLVAVIASVVVVGIGIAAGPRLRDASQIEASAPVLKAGKPVTWTSNERGITR